MTATVVQVFTSSAVPGAGAAIRQVADGAAEIGISTVVVDADRDGEVARRAGVIGLPAAVVQVDGVEVGRRECIHAGRGLDRWLRRSLVPRRENRLRLL